MNSQAPQDSIIEKQETSAMAKFQAVEFTLTQDQYTIIQHSLPKGYTLQERKSNKREKGSSHKLIDAQMSRFSGGFQNTDQDQGRSKRVRTKKIDRYLQQEAPRAIKRVSTQKGSLDEQLSQCSKILSQLKRNSNAIPFLHPVDPKKSGASNYFDIIKDPMDFDTIEKNLNSGQYQSMTQFHADISKIWYNSYAFNQKSSKIYKMTVEMQKYYKKLLAESSNRKPIQVKSKIKSGNQKAKQQNQGVENQVVQQNLSGQQKSANAILSQQNNDYDV